MTTPVKFTSALFDYTLLTLASGPNAEMAQLRALPPIFSTAFHQVALVQTPELSERQSENLRLSMLLACLCIREMSLREDTPIHLPSFLSSDLLPEVYADFSTHWRNEDSHTARIIWLSEKLFELSPEFMLQNSDPANEASACTI